MELDAVFSGGGVRGIGLVGALGALEAAGHRLSRRVGTSAGAVVAGLHAAGYTGAELEPILMQVDLSRYRAWDLPGWLRGWLGRERPVGFYSSAPFEALFAGYLEARGVRTFADLRIPGEPPQYRARMVAADITRGRLVVLPDDIVGYEGYDSADGLSVALAMRISMSIPGYFRPVVLRRDGRDHLLVDGGLISRFPIAALERFADPGPPQRPSVGVYVRWPASVRVWGPASLLLACALTALQARDAERADLWLDRTAMIEGRGVSPVRFGLGAETKRALIGEGAEAMRTLLDSPAFRAYLEEFPAGG